MATATKKRSKKSAQKVTRLEFLIDESGSMKRNRSSVVDGFNEFIEAMRDEKGELLVSLTMFDSRQGPWVRRKFDDVPIGDVSPLTFADYEPRGLTPLNDALFETVEALGSRVRKKENAIVVVMTDGEENQSRHHPGPRGAAEVKDLISRCEDDGWAFIYLGANHDVWAQGGSLGVNAATSFAFTSSPQGTNSAMLAAASNVNAYRTRGTAGLMASAEATPKHIPENYMPPQAKDAKKRKTARKAEIDAAVKVARGVPR